MTLQLLARTLKPEAITLPTRLIVRESTARQTQG